MEKMLLNLITFSLWVLGSDATPTDKLINAAELGRGYDIVLGSPLAHSADPGYRQSVYDMTSYEEKAESTDSRYLVPDGSEFRSAAACTFDGSTTSLSGETSYATAQREVFGVSGGASLFGVSFSASHERETIRETFEKHGSTTKSFLTSARCDAYEGIVAISASLNPNFLSTLQALPAGTGPLRGEFKLGDETLCLYLDGSIPYPDSGSAVRIAHCQFLEDSGMLSQWQWKGEGKQGRMIATRGPTGDMLCLEVNPEIPWALGGAAVDAWSCDDLQFFTDGRQYWQEVQEGVISSVMHRDMSLEVNPYLLRSAGDAWNRVTIPKDGRDKFSIDQTGGGHFTIRGLNNLCLHVLPHEPYAPGGARVLFLHCESSAADPSVRLWQWRDGQLVNKHTGYCLEINPSISYATEGKAIDSWDCNQAGSLEDGRTQWEFKGGQMLSRYEQDQYALEVNPWLASAGVDLWRTSDILGLADKRVRWDTDNIPSDKNQKDSFRSLVEHFGTHYLEAVTLGAQMTQTLSMSSSSFAELSKNVEAVSNAVEVGFKAATAGVQSLNEEQTKTYEKFSKIETHSNSFYKGSVPILDLKDEGLEKWAEKVESHPVAIGGRLKPLSNLFTPESLGLARFPAESVKENFKEWIDNEYCQEIGSKCSEPVPDIDPECPVVNGATCNSEGSCSEGVCHCFNGYTGRDCSSRCGAETTTWPRTVNGRVLGHEGELGSITEDTAKKWCNKHYGQWPSSVSWEMDPNDYCLKTADADGENCNSEHGKFSGRVFVCCVRVKTIECVFEPC